MNEEYLEVNFEKYCKTCQHKELEEKFDPCNRCFTLPEEKLLKTSVQSLKVGENYAHF